MKHSLIIFKIQYLKTLIFNLPILLNSKNSNVFEKLLSFSDIDSEIPMSQYQASVLWSQVELFIESQAYQEHMADPEFA